MPVGLEKANGYDPERVGVIVGSGIGGLMSFEESHTSGLEKGFDRMSPFFILKMISNMAPGRISMRFNCKGANWGPVSACSTSAHAIGEAYRQIRWGELDAAIAGGAEAAITSMGIGGFEAMKALSERVDDPATASRPFDKDRDGFVMGEGAGIVTLEEYESAKRRGATILAEIVGYAANSDAHHETAPAPEHEGAQRCMRQALKSANLKPEDIGYINAHGTSTPFNDLHESKAIKRVFGDHAKKLMVSSTKSMMGHMLGASGGAEAIITALALSRGAIPPTINLHNPDPECDLDYVPNKAREAWVERGDVELLRLRRHQRRAGAAARSEVRRALLVLAAAIVGAGCVTPVTFEQARQRVLLRASFEFACPPDKLGVQELSSDEAGPDVPGRLGLQPARGLRAPQHRRRWPAVPERHRASDRDPRLGRGRSVSHTAANCLPLPEGERVGVRAVAFFSLLLLAGCSTPMAQLKVELGRRASDVLGCPEEKLQYKELDRLISTTKVKITGCGRDATWKLVESRWQRAQDNEPIR